MLNPYCEGRVFESDAGESLLEIISVPNNRLDEKIGDCKIDLIAIAYPNFGINLN